jgi:diamine N-acetyltransferase
MTVVTLRPIDDANREQVLALRVTPEQEQFVESVDQSFRDAADHPEHNPMMRAIYADDRPVGFLMLADPAREDDGSETYFLWRLMIDASHQRRGLGAAAMKELIAYVRARPGATRLVTSAVPGDGSPHDFYVRCGFRPTGEVDHGEDVLELSLA